MIGLAALAAVQLDLLEPAASVPEGFRYRPELLSPEEEQELAARFAQLPLREFEFHGYLGKRRVVSYGLRYDFADSQMHRAEPIPDFLLPLRGRAAAFAGIEPAAVEHALVTEYQPGSTIGWHRDRPVYGDVIGISFLSPCRFRFRRKDGATWRRSTLTLEPRSAYLLCGPARSDWQHSIPPGEELRYSVTFRTLRAR